MDKTTSPDAKLKGLFLPGMFVLGMFMFDSAKLEMILSRDSEKACIVFRQVRATSV